MTSSTRRLDTAGANIERSLAINSTRPSGFGDGLGGGRLREIEQRLPELAAERDGGSSGPGGSATCWLSSISSRWRTRRNSSPAGATLFRAAPDLRRPPRRRDNDMQERSSSDGETSTTRRASRQRRDCAACASAPQQHPVGVRRASRRPVRELRRADETEMPFAGELIQVADEQRRLGRRGRAAAARLRAGAARPRRAVRGGLGLGQRAPSRPAARLLPRPRRARTRAPERSARRPSLVEPARAQAARRSRVAAPRARPPRRLRAAARTPDEFRARDSAPSPGEGQIKHGRGRHEKDDRAPIDDRSNYVLGWSNRQKIDALLAKRADLAARHTAAPASDRRLQPSKRWRANGGESLAKLEDFTRWDELDWRSDGGRDRAAGGREDARSNRVTTSSPSWPRNCRRELARRDRRPRRSTASLDRRNSPSSTSRLEDCYVGTDRSETCWTASTWPRSPTCSRSSPRPSRRRRQARSPGTVVRRRAGRRG